MSFDSISKLYETNIFYKYPFTLSDMKNDIFNIITDLYEKSMKENIRYFFHFTINREEFPVVIIDSNYIYDKEKEYLLKEAYKADTEIIFFNPTNFDEIKSKLNNFYNTRLIYKFKNILREAGSREDSIIYKFIDRIYAWIFSDIVK